MQKSDELEWRLTRLNGEFCVAWDEEQPDGRSTRRRYRLGTSDAREAKALAAARYAELTRPVGRTVADLWAGYQKDKAGKVVLQTMAHTWKALAPTFGKLDPGQITTDLCRLYAVERYGTGKSVGTVHTELGHLRSILVWARDAKLITDAPKIERPSKPAPKDRYLTRDEVRKLIEHAKVPHIALAIRLMIGTGARVSAALELTWLRVDFDRNTISLTNVEDITQRKRRATVPMNNSLRDALLLAKQAALSPYVIEWAGAQVASIKTGIRAAAKSAKLEGVTPHVLRHSAAVWMAEDGHTMTRIAQFLGHSDSRITEKVYARYSPGHLRDLADSLEI
jgi:integrase